MSITPRVSLVAFEDRSPAFIFVAVPNERARYMRTHPCVAVVACPQCGSVVGEPCTGVYSGGAVKSYTCSPHYARSKRAPRGLRPDGDILDIPEIVPDEWMEPVA